MAHRITVDGGSLLHWLRTGIQMTTHELTAAVQRMYDSAANIVKLTSCRPCGRQEDVVPRRFHATHRPEGSTVPLPPRPTYQTGD